MTLAYPAEMDLQPAIWVVPGQGDITDIVAFTDPIVVPPRSHMLAYLTWTSRQIYTTPSSRLLGPFTRLRTVTNMEVSMVLNTENWEPPSALSSTLVLVQREPYITRFFQDSAATPLDGISAFGGAWTFLNGAFLLLFGANIMYFAFGRRPLSALGIAHLCQRRDLTRQWHEDFPALQTEGGQPGSESAGIVAFIRERLLDIELNEDTGEHATAVHVESHELSNENSNPAISALTTLATPTNGGRDGNLVSREGLEYRLDEIPLMSLKGEVGQ
ncbi:hypothetical protein DFH06DRAFT_608098 [Mycena polygramma]|nr:hypothetical protein DFH06DRAFT_608098 [Mycena polygramma]